MELSKDMTQKLAERLINALYKLRDLDENYDSDQTYVRGITSAQRVWHRHRELGYFFLLLWPILHGLTEKLAALVCLG